jgi:tetratricopeptide (TPR) repeat protein
VAYEQQSDFKNAASDYESLSEAFPKEYIYAYKAAYFNFKSGSFQQAVQLTDLAAELAPVNAEIQALRAKCYFALQKYKIALEASDKAISLSPVPENYYLRGLIHKELQNYTRAEPDFRECIKLKPDFTDAIVQHAFILNVLNKPDEALSDLNTAIKQDNKNKEAYLLRSELSFKKGDYNASISDLTKLISFAPEKKAFSMRAMVYAQNSQYNEAIDDYSSVIKQEKNNIKALEGRAACYQKLNKKQEAIKDYTQVVSLIENKKEEKELLTRTKNNLFELKRENNAPVIMGLRGGNANQKVIEVAEGLDIVEIEFKVIDENRIAKFSVNKQSMDFNADSLAAGQKFRVDIQNKTSIQIEAEDVYKNKGTAEYKLIRKDEGLPKVAIISPIATESGIIYLKSYDPEIFIEGRILGRNLVESLFINDIPVILNTSSMNPAFRTKLKLTDTDKLVFVVTDVKGNKIQKTFNIDRSDAAILNENPMGRTWVVFVENTEYQSFSNLEGPKKEIELMIKALSKYRIDNIIHKKNLTKAQMLYFFSTELKNLIVENRVNSLLIWYAGHGKLIGQDGYWVPVDSKVDDVSSYFNINTLKTSIKPYLQNVVHSLIVTDACETGPSFYMSMRTIPTDRNCADTKSTKFKSSQVFTSSGDDLADGDSQFTKSFANSLMYDNNSCVPIERIVNKVSSDVAKTNNKRPKFGRISGFEDENGTFIFIKK